MLSKFPTSQQRLSDLCVALVRIITFTPDREIPGFSIQICPLFPRRTETSALLWLAKSSTPSSRCKSSAWKLPGHCFPHTRGSSGLCDYQGCLLSCPAHQLYLHLVVGLQHYQFVALLWSVHCMLGLSTNVHRLFRACEIVFII